MTMYQGPFIPPGVKPSEAGMQKPLESTVDTLHGKLNVISHGVPPDVWGPVVMALQDKFQLPNGSYVDVKPGSNIGKVHVSYNGQSGSVLLHSDGITY